MKQLLIIFSLLIICTSLATATTLQGSIYNSNLELEMDVLVEINTNPTQKYLAKNGMYTFELPKGEYILTARKGFTEIEEDVKIVTEGTFIYDVFLLSDFSEEDELWEGTEEELFTEEEEEKEDRLWAYVIAAIFAIFAVSRIIYYRKKYGSLRKFKKKMKVEQKKSLEEHKEDLAKEPGYLDQALEIIKKNDGRITQKKLRKEMLYLSEAKVSLILTELEHNGRVEKVKKGRGNVILLK